MSFLIASLIAALAASATVECAIALYVEYTDKKAAREFARLYVTGGR